jgi:hypothetical protein
MELGLLFLLCFAHHKPLIRGTLTQPSLSREKLQNVISALIVLFMDSILTIVREDRYLWEY